MLCSIIGNYSEVKLFAICWNSLVSIGTFNSQNLIGYAESAGNVLSYLITYSLADLNDPVALLCLVPVVSYSNADTKKEQILSPLVNKYWGGGTKKKQYIPSLRPGQI